MSTIVATERFEDSAELGSVLNHFWREAFKALDTAQDPLEIPSPVIYVLGPDGTQFSTAELHQEKLTDGSTVYHVVLKA